MSSPRAANSRELVVAEPPEVSRSKRLDCITGCLGLLTNMKLSLRIFMRVSMGVKWLCYGMAHMISGN